MKKLFGALAAVILALALFSPPVAAHCWWAGHHRHCSYLRHHRVVAVQPRFYQYYTPYRYQPYPYYASYPGPAYRYNYHGCFPIWPFCW